MSVWPLRRIRRNEAIQLWNSGCHARLPGRRQAIEDEAFSATSASRVVELNEALMNRRPVIGFCGLSPTGLPRVLIFKAVQNVPFGETGLTVAARDQNESGFETAVPV